MSAAIDLLRDAFGRVHENVHAVLVGSTPGQLAFRADARSNSPAWLIWHLTRVQDDHLAPLAVHEQTLAFLATLADEDLTRVVDEQWDPPVTLAVRLVSVIDDDAQHVGQAAFAKGLAKRSVSSGRAVERVRLPTVVLTLWVCPDVA